MPYVQELLTAAREKNLPILYSTGYDARPDGFGRGLWRKDPAVEADTLILVGTTTSDCVRATAVDAFSHNFRTVLAEEGCFDRGEAAHAMALFDMVQKYADVMATVVSPLRAETRPNKAM